MDLKAEHPQAEPLPGGSPRLGPQTARALLWCLSRAQTDPVIADANQDLQRMPHKGFSSVPGTEPLRADL